MGSKWIPIGRELPKVNDVVWMLVHSPAYFDLDSEKDIPECCEVFMGTRFVPGSKDEVKRCKNGYEYQLVFASLEDTIYLYDEHEAYPWGQECTIVAWMPMDIPEAVLPVNAYE